MFFWLKTYRGVKNKQYWIFPSFRSLQIGKLINIHASWRTWTFLSEVGVSDELRIGHCKNEDGMGWDGMGLSKITGVGFSIQRDLVNHWPFWLHDNTNSIGCSFFLSSCIVCGQHVNCLRGCSLGACKAACHKVWENHGSFWFGVGCLFRFDFGADSILVVELQLRILDIFLKFLSLYLLLYRYL